MKYMLGSNAGLFLFNLSAEEDLNPYDCVYVSGDGSVRKAYASDPTRMPCCGIVLTSYGVGGLVKTLITGYVENPDWSFTPNRELYLGADGTITDTPPTGEGVVVQRIGRSITSTRIFFRPDIIWWVVA